MSDPNMPHIPTPEQERVRPPMTPEEQHYAELPDQVMPMGRLAMGQMAKIGEFNSIARFNETTGQNMMVIRRVRGKDVNGQPIYEDVHSEPANSTPTAEASSSVVSEEAPSTELAPAPAPQPEKPKSYYNLTPPQKDEFAGLTTEEKMALVEQRAAATGQADAPTAPYNVDRAVQQSPKPAAPKPQPREIRRAPVPEEEDVSRDIPRAVQPDDIQTADPRRDRRKIHFD